MADYKQIQISNFQREVEERRKNFDRQVQQKRSNLEKSYFGRPQEFERAKKELEDEIREFENQINREWDELNEQLSKNNFNTPGGHNPPGNGEHHHHNHHDPTFGPPPMPGFNPFDHGNNNHHGISNDPNKNNNDNKNNNNNIANNNKNIGNQNNINGNINGNNVNTNTNGNIGETIANVNDNSSLPATNTNGITPSPTNTNNEQIDNGILKSSSINDSGSTIIAESGKSGSTIPAFALIFLIIVAVGCMGFFIIRKKRIDKRNKEEFEYNDHSLKIIEDEPSTDYGRNKATVTAPATAAPINDYYQEYANLMANAYNQPTYQNYDINALSGGANPQVVDNNYQNYNATQPYNMDPYTNTNPNVIVNINENNNNIATTTTTTTTNNA